MAHIFNPENMDRLDNPERRKLLPPDDIMRLIGLKRGETFLDIGAGTGYFTFPALTIVGEIGRVIATDISEKMLNELKKRAGTGLDNLFLRHAGGNEIDVAPGSVDLALMAFVLHEIEDKAVILKEVKGALKKEGRLALIEWKKIETPTGPPRSDRIDINDAEGMLKEAGFEVALRQSLNDYHYLLLCLNR